MPKWGSGQALKAYEKKSLYVLLTLYFSKLVNITWIRVFSYSSTGYFLNDLKENCLGTFDGQIIQHCLVRVALFFHKYLLICDQEVRLCCVLLWLVIVAIICLNPKILQNSKYLFASNEILLVSFTMFLSFSLSNEPFSQVNIHFP